MRRAAPMLALVLTLGGWESRLQAADACCVIVAVNQQTASVSAKVNATGQQFEFKPANPALLGTLKPGEAVYANFQTHAVSLDGTTTCCSIIETHPALAQAVPSITSSTTTAPTAIRTLKVRIVTADEEGAGTDDPVYFGIGPLGWRLDRPNRNDFERGSDATYDLDLPAGSSLTTQDVLYLRLQKKGVGGIYDAPDGVAGAWKPHKVTLYVNGAAYPDGSCCLVDQWLEHGHGLWTHFFPYNDSYEVFARSLRLLPNASLGSFAEESAFFSTDWGKNQGFSGWLKTGSEPSCATGLVLQVATSTDGLATIDLVVQKLEVGILPVTTSHHAGSTTARTPEANSQTMRPTQLQPSSSQPQYQVFWLDGRHGIPNTRYVRVECPKYQARCNPLPQRYWNVRVCGEVCRDMDFETWLEIHPRAPSDYNILAPRIQTQPTGTPATSLPAHCREPILP